METNSHSDRNRCNRKSVTSVSVNVTRTLVESTMANSTSVNDVTGSTRGGNNDPNRQRQGLSPTDLMTEKLEASVSPGVRRRIDAIAAEVQKFNDLEKLLLVLKLPTGVNGYDPSRSKSASPALTVTRVEQTQAFSWIQSHLEQCSDTALPKHEVYEDYRYYCESASRRVLSTADFGKIMKSVFPQVKARRLGTRGNAKYCYSGLRKKSEILPPSLPSMESPKIIGPNDFPHSSSLCECSKEQQQRNLASMIVICEWATSVFPRQFQTADELAHYLASNNLVTNSMASFTVLSTSKDASVFQSLRADAGTAKLPITPLERRKETNHQLQKKLQQRKLNKMKEEQMQQQHNERFQAIKCADPVRKQADKSLNRSLSVPNEVQMNARVDAKVSSGAREPERGNCTNNQRDQAAPPPTTQSSVVLASNNSNNNSNQMSTATTALVAAIKESPNHKRRFTPIQPKTPVRDKGNSKVNNLPKGQLVVLHNGQKIQQLSNRVQFIPMPPGLANGSSQQVTSIPLQSIPSHSGATVASSSSPGTTPSTCQNIMLVPVQRGQVLKNAPVSGGVLVLNKSPSAGLVGSVVNGTLPCKTVPAKPVSEPNKPSQSNNQNATLLFQDSSLVSPQGGSGPANSCIAHPTSSLSPLSNISSPPQQLINSPPCFPSSTVLKPVSEDARTSALGVGGQQFRGAVEPFCPTAASLKDLSSTTPITAVNLQKQQVLLGVNSLPPRGGHYQPNNVRQMTSGDIGKLPIGIGNSASILLAYLSETANMEQQGQDDQRVGGNAFRANPKRVACDTQPTSLFNTINGAVTSSVVGLAPTASPVQSVSNSSPSGIATSQVVTDCQFGSVQQAMQTLCYTEPSLQMVPTKSLADQHVLNSRLISILEAPTIGTTHISHHATSGQQQTKDPLSLIPGQSLQLRSVPIHTGDQSLNSNASPMPIPLFGNKRFALTPVQQTAPAVSVQHNRVFSIMNEVTPEVSDTLNINVKEEMESLGSRFLQQGVSQSVGLGNGSRQCTPVGDTHQQVGIELQGRPCGTPTYNPRSNAATPVPSGLDSVPQSPNEPNQTYFTFTPIQQSADQSGVIPSPTVQPMQKPTPTHSGASQASFATPNRKRRTSGTTRRSNPAGTGNCLPPVAGRQITLTISPSGSRCSTPKQMVSSQTDAASMPPPSPGMISFDANPPTTTSKGPINQDLIAQVLSQPLGPAQWPAGSVAGANRKRNPSGPPSIMQLGKHLTLDSASFLPEDLKDLNFSANIELNRAQQQFQRSHSVPCPVYQPVVLSQDRLISNFPPPTEQRGITVNNRSFGAKRNLTQELQEIQVSDEDFNPSAHLFTETNDTAFNDLLNGDLHPPTQGQGSWPADTSLTGMQSECPADLNVDFPINSEQAVETELGLSQSNSNSTTSTLNEEIAAMDDMGSNPVFRDFTLPIWQQMSGSNSNLTLECGM